MDDIASYAELGNKPIAESQIVDATYTLLYNSGLYFETLIEWDNKPEIEKTWEAFKDFTVQAQTKLFRQQAVTTASRGYGYHAQRMPPPPVGYVFPPTPPYTAPLTTDTASMAGSHMSQLTTAMTEQYANFANSVTSAMATQLASFEKRLAGH